MNYIKIYFALPDELAKERDELADYIRSLNDFYHDRDIFFEVNFGGDPFYDFLSVSDEDPDGENQRNDIRESNYFYLIFGCHDDEEIREKFDVALAEFSKNGTPKIYTYFKKLPEGVETEQGIRDFIDRLDQALGHYYSQFVHIDSVKLNILLELTNTSKNGDKLEFEDGHATINGTKVLPLDNIPIYQCNESLQQLKAEKARLEQEFAGAAVNYAQNPNDQEAFNKMMDLSGERNRVTDKIHEIEKGMLGLCNTISEMRHSDRKLTWREVEAGKRLDLGDYDGALMILRDDQREKELAQAEAIANEGIERIRGYIAENRMIISTLKTKGVSVDTLDELYSRYEKNTELAKEYHIELDCVYNYISFLYDQREFSRAIALGEWLRPFYQEDDEKIDLFNVLGLCYHEIYDYRQARAFYELSLEISRKLAQNNPEVYEINVAGTCDYMATLLRDSRQYEESEKLYCEALEILRRLAGKNPEAYEYYMAKMSCNFANLLRDLRQYEESEKLYREALEIHRRLVQKNPEAYQAAMGATCNELAILLRELHQYEESEKLFRESLEISRMLFQKNPETYEVSVAITCNSLAYLLENLHQYEESEQLYRESLEIFRRLAERNPEAYENDLARLCGNLAYLMMDLHQYEEAEKLHREALDIHRRLFKKNPEVHEYGLAIACYEFANLLRDLCQYEESEKLFREALEIFRRLSQKEPDAYVNDVIATCSNLANILWKSNRYDEAEKLYREVLEICRRLNKKNPDAYEYEEAVTCNNLAALLTVLHQYEEAEKMYLEALGIRIRLAQKSPEAYESDVATTYNNLAILLYQMEQPEEAVALFWKTLEIYKRLSERDPDVYEPMCANIEEIILKIEAM